MFYGIKSLAFLLHETKIGKGVGADGRDGGEQETALPRLLAATPHFFLHNFWHLLPAMPALSVSERGHTLIVMLGEYCRGKARLGVRRAAEATASPVCREPAAGLACSAGQSRPGEAQWAGTGEDKEAGAS